MNRRHTRRGEGKHGEDAATHQFQSLSGPLDASRYALTRQSYAINVSVGFSSDPSSGMGHHEPRDWLLTEHLRIYSRKFVGVRGELLQVRVWCTPYANL